MDMIFKIGKGINTVTLKGMKLYYVGFIYYTFSIMATRIFCFPYYRLVDTSCINYRNYRILGSPI